MVDVNHMGLGPRVLFVSPDYPPPLIGGALVYIYNLVIHFPVGVHVLTGPLPCGLTEITDNRHKILRSRFIVSSFKPSARQLVVSYMYMAGWFFCQGLLHRYDRVIVSSGVVGNSIFVILGRLFRVPVIVMAYAEELTLPFGRGQAKERLKRFLIRRIYKYASKFVSVCAFTRDLLVSHGVAQESIQVIPTTVNPDKIVKISREKISGKTIISVGRVVRRKGFDYLIRAVSHLKKGISDIKLFIVGEGPQLEELKDLVKTLELEKEVFLKGAVGDRELAELYAQADLFVLANVLLDNGDCEGCPNVLVEASACGLPVIGGRQGGASAAIEDGVNGYLVDCRDIMDLADKIKRVLCNPSLAISMGEAGQAKVSRDHCPDMAARKFFDFAVLSS